MNAIEKNRGPAGRARKYTGVDGGPAAEEAAAARELAAVAQDSAEAAGQKAKKRCFVMKCRWYAEFEGVCTNGMCPYRADICPVIENQEVCVFSNHRKNITDLNGKCGSCKYGQPCAFTSNGNLTYVRCGHPEKFFKREYQAVKQRTTKACKRYERRCEE